MDQLTWQALATPAASVAAVTLLLTICKTALAAAWRPMVNGILALVFGVAVSVGMTAGIGVANGSGGEIAAAYILAVLNGIIVAGAVLGVTTRYDAKSRG